MCIAAPGKIIKIKGDTAKVDIMNNICDANIKLVNANVGDYVLIHAGCVIEVLKEDAAKELISLFRELEEVSGIEHNPDSKDNISSHN